MKYGILTKEDLIWNMTCFLDPSCKCLVSNFLAAQWLSILIKFQGPLYQNYQYRVGRSAENEERRQTKENRRQGEASENRRQDEAADEAVWVLTDFDVRCVDDVSKPDILICLPSLISNPAWYKNLHKQFHGQFFK